MYISSFKSQITQSIDVKKKTSKKINSIQNEKEDFVIKVLLESQLKN